MKRRGRKSGTARESNGVEDREENGAAEASDNEQEEDQQNDQPAKRSPRKSKSNAKYTAKGSDEDEDEEEAPEAKKKKPARKSKPADEDEDEPETKKKKAGRKSKAAKDASDEEEGDEENEEPVKKKQKTDKKSKAAAKDSEEAENNDGGESSEGEAESQYEVQSVLEEKMISGVRHFLIRWKGYEPESDTWEPESTLNCPELIAEFRKKKKGAAAKKDESASSSSSSSKKPKGKPSGAGKRKKSKKEDEPTEEWDENEDFEVGRILDVYFKKNGQREFLVSWKGYPSSMDSWEPEENMSCKDLIEKYMAKVDKAKESSEKELRVKREPTNRFTLMQRSTGRKLSKRNQGKQRATYYDAE